jgi:hypothetical protein
MAGLVPAIHVFSFDQKVVDARHKAGHDEAELSGMQCRPVRRLIAA